MGSIGTARITLRSPSFSQTPSSAPQPVNQNNPDVANQAPSAKNTPVTDDAVTKFSQLDDSSMAALIAASKRAVLPNQLADQDDITQRIVFQAGINEKPMVLDSQAFNKYVNDNNLQNNILSRQFGAGQYRNQSGRSVNLTTQDVDDMMKYSRLNYIGGKQGGHSYGMGTYLEQTGRIGKSTGYGYGNTKVSNAVLNPQTSRIIGFNSLSIRAKSFMASHPKTAAQLGRFNSSTASAYALAMGYNVISSDANGTPSVHSIGRGDYLVVLDRKALVWLK